MKKPLASIILPVYNGEKYLKRSIESVLSQSFSDFELIIINDGSADKTKKVLEKFRSNKKIKIFNQRNIGLVKTLNKGIKLAKGKYIARIDDDDLWYDFQKLEKQISFMEKNPEYVLVGGGVLVIDKNSKESFRYLKPKKDQEIREKMFFSCPFAHSSVLFSKKEALIVGCYNEDVNYSEDWEFWMRLGKKGKMFNFPDYFIKYRSYEENVSTRYCFEQIWESIENIKINKNKYPNYFLGLMYNYLKFYFFFLPFSKFFFKKFLHIRNN